MATFFLFLNIIIVKFGINNTSKMMVDRGQTRKFFEFRKATFLKVKEMSGNRVIRRKRGGGILS